MALVRTHDDQTTDVALLAPVPFEHLSSGVETCSSQGKVAFGSRAWEVFRQLDSILKGRPCPVFIYASWDQAPFPPKATWKGTYLGHIEGKNGAHPAGNKYRPSSTEKYTGDNSGHWAIFWEISDLCLIAPDKVLPISSLLGLNAKKAYASGFRPEGPLLIENPLS